MTGSQKLYDAQHIRNVAVLGHAGAGKTTLIESLLGQAGAIPARGSLAAGTTVTDFTAQEKQLGHSLDVAVCYLEHTGSLVNLLDTPGYPDFFGRAVAALPAAETAAVVVNAQHGIEPVTNDAMAAAESQNMCRLIIVNKIDSPEADPAALLAELRATFGAACLPLNLPADGGRTARRSPISVEATHTEIVDQVVELDDELMELYLEKGQQISLEQLHDPFERALRRGHLIPVCFVSAETGAGMRQLLRIITELMPNPLEGIPAEFVRSSAPEEIVRVDPSKTDAHFIGHVFKITIDPYVGRLGMFRVHQGRIRSGEQIYIGEQRKAVKIAHLYRVQGKRLDEIASAGPGNLCAVSKIDELGYDDVLHDSHDEDELRMRLIDIPEPMYALAIEPEQRGHEKKLSDTLHKLTAEDPSLKLEFNAQANETVLRGMGELHLRVVLEHMSNDLGLKVTTHAPRVAYRETVTRQSEGHFRHKKQTGGAGQFGEVFLCIEPLERGSGFEFVNAVVGGSIPGQFIPAVEKGIRQVLEEGAVTGNPMQDIRVTVYDGKHHPVDSKEIAFITAGKKAFLDAVAKADPIVLEPIARVVVTVPSEAVGDVTGHLAGIRGRITGSDVIAGNRSSISADVPLAELTEFQAKLKSLTGGEGTFTLHLDHYETAPPNIQKALEQEYRPGAA